MILSEYKKTTWMLRDPSVSQFECNSRGMCLLCLFRSPCTFRNYYLVGLPPQVQIVLLIIENRWFDKYKLFCYLNSHYTSKTSQMVHFVFKSFEFHVRCVNQTTRWGLYNVVNNCFHCIVIHLAGIGISLAGLDPHFQQIFVETVSKGAKRNVLCSKEKINKEYINNSAFFSKW